MSDTSMLELHVMFLLIFYNTSMFYPKATRNIDVLCLGVIAFMLKNLWYLYFKRYQQDSGKMSWLNSNFNSFIHVNMAHVVILTIC